MSNINIIKEKFYNPKYGFHHLNTFYDKLHHEHPEIKKQEVENFYKNQILTQVFRRNTKPKIFNSVVANYPKDIYEMDFIIYDRYNIHHYKYIFCCIDIYSRYAEAIPTTNMTNETIIKCLKKIFNSMGKPYKIKCDNQFNKTELIKFLDAENINYEFTDPNEKNKNPIIERFNGTIERKIALYRVASNNKLWYKYLPNLIYNYNHTKHRTTKDTPDNIFNKGAYNQQEIIRVEPKFNLGDRVRIKEIKKQFGKGDIMTYGEEIKTITNIQGNKIFLDNETKKYKPYEIKKISDIDYTDDYINSHHKELEPKIPIYFYNNPEKRVSEKGINIDNIISNQRERRKIKN
jgi:hypothetical protein